ncbi:efflux RND transporter periplasmic adaptor subunit [Methyloferula stellata]|uniref:efflux RND transporter periplasmic adaptor subunit n=1 Tax=Methyloferula stellata TaxID=876270 RepID=UPI0003725BEC|nr:efflux RND transporter periplasmic adaptor subunit [Methyloferula stellata]
MKRALLFLFVLILLVSVTGGLGYFQFVVKPQMIKTIIASSAPPPPAVAVAKAVVDTWTPRLPAVGTFRAVQGIDVSSQLAGTITAIHVQNGQDVAKGAALFDIDTSVEEADLKNNLATLKNNEISLDRQRRLTDSGNAAKANLDAAQMARDTAEATVEKMRATIAQKTVVAPFAGRLGLRRYDLGQYLSPGTAFITLQQLDPIYVDFPIPEQSIARLKPGEPLEVTVDGYPNKTFRGKIETIDARVAQDTRNVTVRGLFANPDRVLLPGMFANVAVIAGESVERVVLPRTAITYSLYGDSVFVVVPVAPPADGAQAAAQSDISYKIERRAVRTGDVLEDRVAILEGVKAGETVVTEGQLKLQAEARVRPDFDAKLTPRAVRPKE